MLRIVLADDHALLRSGLRSILEAQPDLSVVGEAKDGQSAQELAGELLPDVLQVTPSAETRQLYRQLMQ